MPAAPVPSDRRGVERLRRFGPLLAAFVACVWLNQSVGFIAWQPLRDRVFADPAAHVFDFLRYPFIFLYRRSGDEALYYGAAAQILGEPYDQEAFQTHKRGRVPGLALFDAPPPPADGHLHMPWTEVRLEYPAPAVPFLVLPKLFTTQFEPYCRVFGLLMGASMIGAIALAIDVAKRARMPRASLEARWWLATGLLLAEGAVTIQRLDPIVALAMIATVHGAVRRSPWQFGLFAGLAGACKVVPLLLVPVIVATDWTFWRARALRASAWIAVGLALGFGPMLLVSPAVVPDLFRYHAARGLQIETTLAVLLGAVRWVAGTTVASSASYGSFNLDGAIPDLLAKVTLPLTLAGIAALVLVEVRRNRDGEPQDESARIERITCAALAATAVIWLSGKVFSPQYLTWGIPLALAIPGRRGARATFIFVLALALTQLYFRGYYDVLIEQRFVAVFTVFLRQAVLVALLVFVASVAPRVRRPGEIPRRSREQEIGE